MEDPESKSEFKVSDKRRFTQEGETKEETAQEEQTPETEEPQERVGQEEPGESGGQEAKAADQPLPMDFATFLLSMANTAFFQLGMIRDPASGETHKDLPAARQTIDLMALIEEKTRGNLTDQEARILKEALFQLRMAFVEASK